MPMQSGNMGISSSGKSFGTHLYSGTRSNILSLRNSNALVPGRSYEIIDHIQGRLVAGTTVTLLATSTTELGHDVRVNTTYDNTSWFGLYDIDTALVYELRDNRGNIARGINGTEVSNFDWGNASYTNVVVDNATLTADIGNIAVKSNVTVEKGAILNLTGFTGAINNITLSTAVNANFTGANGTWRLSTIRGGGAFNVSGYTGGGDNYYNEIDGANNINFSNSSSLVTLRQNEISGGSTITHSGVSTGAFNLSSSKVMSSVITHAVGAGNFTAISNNHFLSGCVINHQTGIMTLTTVHSYSSTIQQGTNTGAIMTLNQLHAKHGSNISNQATGTLSIIQSIAEPIATIQRTAGATGTLTINYTKIGSSSILHQATNTGNSTISYCIIDGASTINNSSAVVMNITRAYLKGNSNITAQAGSAGNITCSDTDLTGYAAITKLAASTSGTISTGGGTILESSGFIQTAGTGNITVSQGNIIGSSGINCTAGDRNYTFTRLYMSGIGRANLSGTNAAITDTHNELEIRYRGNYNNFSAGAVANQVNSSEVTGLSGVLSFGATSSGHNLNRIKIYDGTANFQSPNASICQLWKVSDAGIVTVLNNVAGDVFNYIDVANQSNVTINKTAASNISILQVINNGAYNMTGAAGAVSKVLVEQGTLSHSGGTLTNVSKKMTSTFTVTGGTQNNVHHWNTAAKTTAVNNTNKVDYLGLVSTAPII